MNRFLIIILLFPVLTSCTQQAGGNELVEVPLFSDVLTLDLTIEDSDGNGEILLVEPNGIAVDGAGRIYVADEECLKLFDENGHFIQQIGREGQGPGEFVAAFDVSVGPSGYVTAKDILWEFNIYGPDHSFITKSRYRNEEKSRKYIQDRGYTFTMLNEVVSLDADHRLINLFALDMANEELFPSFEQILYIRPDTLIELCRYHAKNSVRTGPGSNNGLSLQGELLWSLIDGDRLVYTESGIDYSIEKDSASYFLHIVSLRDLEGDTLAVPFQPLRVPAACRSREYHYFEVLGRRIDYDPLVIQMDGQVEHYPPLKALRADGALLFGFSFSELDSIWHDIEEEGRMIPSTVDLIDLDRDRLVARAEFPFIPDVIRDGYAYLLHAPEDDFPSIRRYRIDTRLYNRD